MTWSLCHSPEVCRVTLSLLHTAQLYQAIFSSCNLPEVNTVILYLWGPSLSPTPRGYRKQYVAPSPSVEESHRLAINCLSGMPGEEIITSCSVGSKAGAAGEDPKHLRGACCRQGPDCALILPKASLV